MIKCHNITKRLQKGCKQRYRALAQVAVSSFPETYTNKQVYKRDFQLPVGGAVAVSY